MESMLAGQQQRQHEKNKELRQQQKKEETQATIKKDGGLLQLLPSEGQGSGRRASGEQGGLTLQPHDADIEVITIDSDDSTEFSECGLLSKGIERALGVPPTEGGGIYSSRLRSRETTKKKHHRDFLTHELLGLSVDGSEQSERCLFRQLRNAEARLEWGKTKLRTVSWRDCERLVTSRSKSDQGTRSRNLRAYGRPERSQEGLTERSECHGKNNPLPSDRNHSRRASILEPAPLQNEISGGGRRRVRSLQEWNASAGCRTGPPNCPSSSLGRIASPCKRNQPAKRCNMVTQMSFRREFGGLHEGPAAPLKPPVRKRKAEILAEEFPEALSNGRARSDGTERAVQVQLYQLSSDEEDVGAHCPGSAAGLVVKRMDEFVDGRTAREEGKDDKLDVWDKIVNGEVCRPSSTIGNGNGSQFYSGTESCPNVPVYDMDASIEYGKARFSPEWEGASPLPQIDAFDVPSEPSESLPGAQSEANQSSDEDYQPPAGFSGFQSTTDDVGSPIQSSYPSRSRRSLSFRNDGATRKVRSIRPFAADVQPSPATPNTATQPLSNTSAVMPFKCMPDNQQASLSTPFTPSMTDARRIMDVQEDLEPDDEDLSYEEDEDAEDFDLNELPGEPPRKISRTRKKHRPKVFREGRPYRYRKPKNPEEEIAKKKASEGKKVAAKPRGRKKQASADLKSNVGEEQCSHSMARDANCGPEKADCVQCQENRRVSEVERVTNSQECPQTPHHEYVLVMGPKNSLVAQRNASPLYDRDDSPLSMISASASPSLSRKRVGEDASLIDIGTPLRRLGARRELFKKARSKRRTATVEQGIELGEISPESLNVATVHPAATTLEDGPPVGKNATGSLEFGHLDTPELSMGEAFDTPCFISAQEGGAMILRGCNPPNCEEGAPEELRIIPTEVDLHTRRNTVFPMKLRAAARAKRKLPTVKIAPSRRSPAMPRRRTKPMDPLEEVTNEMARLGLTETDSRLQIVPHANQQRAVIPFVLMRKKPRAKVMLDGEDKRVWRLLMTQGTSFEDDNSEKDSTRQWEEERATMKARAEKFINRMHLVQGDRRFSVWKGSVVDSVVGAFLTQNVSDHLSSSAFMCLAARFPVPRKKKAAAETSQETTVTQVRVEESFDIHVETSQETTVTQVQVEESFGIHVEASGLPLTGEVAEAVQESSIAAFHVEEAFNMRGKSSPTEGVSSICCYQRPQDHTETEWHNYADERLINVREQNNSCSSKNSQSHSHCNSCGQNPSSPAGESLEVRETQQRETCMVVEDFPPLQSGLGDALEDIPPLQSGQGDALLASSGHFHANGISSLAFADFGEIEEMQLALAPSASWTHTQTVSEMLEGSLIVDLSLTADDVVINADPTRNFNLNGLRSQFANETLETGRSSISQSLNFEKICASAEAVAASSGSVVSSSDSSDADKLFQLSVIPPSEGNCGIGEILGTANTAGVIVSSDSLDTDISYDKQLVISSAGEIDSTQLQRGLSYATESSNLHTLQTFRRRKLPIKGKGLQKKGPSAPGVNGNNSSSKLVNSASNDLVNGNNSSQLVNSASNDLEKEVTTFKTFTRRKFTTKGKGLMQKGPNAPGVNGKGSSELVNSASNDTEKEVSGARNDIQKELSARGRGRGRGSVLGLTGIDRARLEESNITSKVAFDWEAVRLKYTEMDENHEMDENRQESPHAGCKSFGSSHVENGVDWDAVRSAKLEDIANVIKERGMNNVLAGRIKAFLERVQKEHGSVDLEWLRTVSVEEAKSFLLSIRGLGLKSVECIRLLTLHHLAFPVDTNVGRICVRLGWVPLEPLPEELQLHLLELYPVQETIQKYLWPRLCSLDQRTLYELHYQMITFGKVFCTKSRPNCNACPMQDDCHHFASALASSRLSLPAAPHDDSNSTSSKPLALPAAAAEFLEKVKLALPPSEQDDGAGEEGAALSKSDSVISSPKPCEPIIEEPCEPIVEEPSTPEPMVANSTEIEDIEDFGEQEIFFGTSSQPSASDKFSTTDVEIVLPPAEVQIQDTASKALVILPPGRESIPVPKLKNIGRLRTVHYVYELPDTHPLVQEMDPREGDDPCCYLLAIWSPGESPQAPPVLDDLDTNGTCDGFNSTEGKTVKGTVLVPCRTAMRGIFPLNGTYFQVNEVFADHASSLQPIEVPRTLLWNLRRRFVYFGTSVTTIFKGLSTEEIQACFWRGYVCVRGFDSVSRCPRPLAARLHFPASKVVRKTKDGKDSEDA